MSFELLLLSKLYNNLFKKYFIFNFSICSCPPCRRGGGGENFLGQPDLSPIEHVWNMMGRRLHLPGNVDDLVGQLEQIWQEIPQETIRGVYHSMPRRVAACIQARGRSTPY
ncbi:transposable element Tcb1 transposase [Trichonephila clavipes]|nr:transposable element Tcb1 transposase [Trichonephila clavipes]